MFFHPLLPVVEQSQYVFSLLGEDLRLHSGFPLFRLNGEASRRPSTYAPVRTSTGSFSDRPRMGGGDGGASGGGEGCGFGSSTEVCPHERRWHS